MSEGEEIIKVRVCVKCHRIIPESDTAKIRHCPYCGGTLIYKYVASGKIHHVFPDGAETVI